MIKRCNYTRRVNLREEQARVRIVPMSGAVPPHFEAEFEFADAGLDPRGRLVVEAYRQTQRLRWSWGTVAQPLPPPREERSLAPFGEADQVHFRLKVVAPARAGGTAEDAQNAGGVESARLLASCNGIKPERPGKPDPAPSNSMLTVMWDDDSDASELWRLDLDESTGPILKFSRRVLGDRPYESVLRSHEFISIAMPAIFREVTRCAMEKAKGETRGEDWYNRWLRFIDRVVPGAGEPPRARADGDDPDPSDVDDWINRAAKAFARWDKVRVADRVAWCDPARGGRD